MSSRHGREGELSRAVRVPEERLGEYWSWLAVALFLLVSVDLLTSLGAAASVGIDVESNPVMAWLLTRSPAALVAVHVAAVVVAAAFFHALIETMRAARPPTRTRWPSRPMRGSDFSSRSASASSRTTSR